MVNAVTQVVTEAEENVRAGKLADKPVMIAQCDDPLSELMTIDDLQINWKLKSPMGMEIRLQILRKK